MSDAPAAQRKAKKKEPKPAARLQLHEPDAAALWEKLALILNDAALSPAARLQLVIKSTFEAQAAAAEHHATLQDAPRVVETQAFTQFAQGVTRELEAFLRDALPARRDECHFLAGFCFTVVAGLLDQIANKPIAAAEARKLADETVNMLVQHLGL